MSNLQIRDKGTGIFKVSDYDETQSLADFGVEEASAVILRCDGKSVVVRELRTCDDRNFLGTVSCIEPPGGVVPGLSEGDDIRFREENVISMAR